MSEMIERLRTNLTPEMNPTTSRLSEDKVCRRRVSSCVMLLGNSFAEENGGPKVVNDGSGPVRIKLLLLVSNTIGSV